MRGVLQRIYLFPAAAFAAFGFGRSALYWRLRWRQALQLPRGFSPARNQVLRWRHYFLGTTYLRLIFTLLSRQTTGRRNLALFAQLSALAGHFDDLTEVAGRQNTNEPPRGLTPETFGRQADPGGLALHLLHRISAALPPGSLSGFDACLQRVFQLETAGRQQKAGIAPAELRRLTVEKGGYSVRLFRMLLPQAPSPAEQAALLELGGMIQLSDDIFDLWFDCRDGISTLPTCFAAQNDLAGLSRCFEQQRCRTLAAVQNMPVSALRKGLALEVLHFLTALTRVCLRHYRRLQKKHGTLPLHNRRALVADMDRWYFRRQAVAAVWTKSPFSAGEAKTFD